MLSRVNGYALGVLLLLGTGACCENTEDICAAWAEGDILIGVLNSCHSKVETLHTREKPERYNCTEFNLVSFVRTLAVIHTIETINDLGFLPGIRLGYEICDTCSDATKAIQSTEHLLAVNGTLPIRCDVIERPRVKAIIGARYSEVSIVVARLLSLYMVPQISATSSAPILSDRLRYPSFLRTMPSDVHQTKALASLMAQFGWDWVGVVHGDDEYGKGAFHSFLEDAEEAGVCTAFEKVLPHYLDHSDIDSKVREVARTIQASKARIVLLILKGQLVEKLFQEMIRENISRTWIASDAWSMSRHVASMEGINNVGDIFGFSFITGQNPGFKQYLQGLKSRPARPGAENRFVEEYKKVGHDDDHLTEAVDITLTYGERLAVWSIAHALRRLLECNQTACPGEKDFPPWKLLKELKSINFTLDNQQFYFNESGNFMNGYDLIHWAIDKDENKRIFKIVGEYNLIKTKVEVQKDAIVWGNPNNTVPESKCSKTCPPGTAKKISSKSCCYNCTVCVEGTYSDAPNLANCYKCPNGTWSLKGSAYCEARKYAYFRWNKPIAIVLLTMTGVGFLLLAVILIMFLISRRTPVVKQAGGEICFVIIAGLVVSFSSVVLFIGRPNDHICRSRQTMYGLGFTLVVSCILVKAFRTFMAFLPQHRQHKLKKFYKPPAIIAAGTALQALICTFWLIFDSPKMEVHISEQSIDIKLQCSEGSNLGFGAMHSYVGLLAVICFLLAFKGRKVPQRFNETGYIIFSMLIYLFVWVCFIPIYVTKIQQRSIVQAAGILLSNYGIIFCHFLPKCYMMLCKKKNDITRQAYLDRVRIFSITATDSALKRIAVDYGADVMQSVAGPNIRGSQATMNSTDSGTSSMESFANLDVSSCISSLGVVGDDPQGRNTSPKLRKRARRKSI